MAMATTTTISGVETRTPNYYEPLSFSSIMMRLPCPRSRVDCTRLAARTWSMFAPQATNVLDRSLSFISPNPWVNDSNGYFTVSRTDFWDEEKIGKQYTKDNVNVLPSVYFTKPIMIYLFENLCPAPQKKNATPSCPRIFSQAVRFPPQHRMNANYAINNLLAINLTNSRPRNRSSRVVTWSKRPHTPPQRKSQPAFDE